jgi:hypothetical protein
VATSVGAQQQQRSAGGAGPPRAALPGGPGAVRRGRFAPLHWRCLLRGASRAAAAAAAAAAGPQQLDSSVGTGFWLDEVCMYVYENSGRMFGRGVLAGGSLRDFDGVHLEHRKIF